MIRSGEQMTLGQQARLSLMLSWPAIIAQLSSVLMQFIDAAMVGHLGTEPVASIELVSTCTWLFGGFCIALCSGFSVQVAHLFGASQFRDARDVLRYGLTTGLLFSLLLCLIGVGISGPLPRWLGGSPEITGDATSYFFVYSLFLPFMQIAYLASNMLQSSGNMKTPSIIFMCMGAMDVIFNYIFIYKAGMGVTGAALGTGLSELVAAGMMLYFLAFRSEELKLTQEKGSFIPTRKCLRKAMSISMPMFLQNIVMRGAHIASTVIVAPLGTIALAANGFAIIAESLCYMPGYGIADAATALVGQSLGAGRKQLAKNFARLTVFEGMSIMTLLSVIMFIFAPQMIGILTPDTVVIDLGARMLRIEAFAETMFAASIVAYGACVGAGDTLVPSIMNLVSMWVMRVLPAFILTKTMGLQGFWIAMCLELNFRGIIFLIRLRGSGWMKKHGT